MDDAKNPTIYINVVLTLNELHTLGRSINETIEAVDLGRALFGIELAGEDAAVVETLTGILNQLDALHDHHCPRAPIPFEITDEGWKA